MTTPLPTLFKDQEQVKLERLRNRYKCYASHLWVTKDARGHIWPFLECQKCDQMRKCRQLKLMDEEELNG